jgi:hypothetical protein
MERAALNSRRSLSTAEIQNLQNVASKMRALRTERRTASHFRREEIDLELRRLSAQCESTFSNG